MIIGAMMRRRDEGVLIGNQLQSSQDMLEYCHLKI